MKSSQYPFSSHVNNFVISLVNEPTLGLYYIQQHLKETAPLNFKNQQTIKNTQDSLNSANLDLENTIQEVKQIGELIDT